MASQDYATPSKSIDAQALINDAPLSKYQWMIAIICFLIIFYWWYRYSCNGFYRSSIGSGLGRWPFSVRAGDECRTWWNDYWALVSGPTADRFGRKIVLAFSMLVFGGFTLASAYATNLDSLVVLRFWQVLGLAQLCRMRPLYFLSTVQPAFARYSWHVCSVATTWVWLQVVLLAVGLSRLTVGIVYFCSAAGHL